MINFQVAIDGPAGSGKSSISDLIAQRLNFIHIDTGAMYRAITLEALNRGINLDNGEEYNFINDIKVVYTNNKIFLNDKDVSDQIRSIKVTENVSTVSKYKTVRDKMLEFQRDSASHGLVLMDGRDIGTVVLPKAHVKIFLTASKEERAKRRLKELELKGVNTTYDEILASIVERDYKDSTREIAPLVAAKDAIVIDTTVLTIEEVCNKIIEIINVRLKTMNDNKKDLYSSHIVRVGEVLKGVVVSIDDRCIYLNIDTFAEGTMYLNHYSLDKEITTFKGLVKVGDVIDCEVTKVDESRGEILLSRLNIAKKEAFVKFHNEITDSIKVKITKKVNKGYICTSSNIEFFLPEKEVDEVKIGQTLEVKVLNVDEERQSGLVSRKAFERAVYQNAKQEELESIKVGDVLTGEIANIENYGIFVKFKYNNGLIRLKEIDHVYVTDPKKDFTVGSKIEVKVINNENGKIELSRKALLKSPFEIYTESHKVSDVVKCTVSQKLPFGVVFELADNVNGLLHTSEFSWNPNDNLMASLKIKDEMELAIIAIDPKKQKISLSRKALIDNPWGRVDAKEDDVITAVIKEISSKGLVIEALGVDGFIPANEVVLDKKSSKLEDYYDKGEEIKAIITEINPKAWVLKASAKKYQNIIEKEQFSQYMDKQNEETVSTTLGDLFKDVLKNK